MGYDVMARTCPSRVVLHRIGARWTVFVVNALEHQPLRFVELRTHIQGITPKVLTETLRTLERDGLVARTDHEEHPPRVEYELTELGRSLLEPLRAVRRWAEAHIPEIQAANAAAAAREPGDS
ncbi:helix-turn-helix domain-containing protein [Nocardioides sp. YIM 152315]|uniref:winged helix-turn-helix transcriptional regulator n=1 Tax=Nocardioides sp. YIM 152315 TaxID=3031760 RepID=UPI0023DC4960|nr:helix-turn-helix domain-containing protein [Nocardioides sp. YIM 152315]MDF1602925.1 helix-turn-helix domain-containing protein [Nocardioides sp. YIM 152315]